jgi:hypothetical protein
MEESCGLLAHSAWLFYKQQSEASLFQLQKTCETKRCVTFIILLDLGLLPSALPVDLLSVAFLLPSNKKFTI